MTQQRKRHTHQAVPSSPFLLVCVCAYLLRICASDGAHVFMHSGRTGAACNSSPACRSKEHSRCSDVSPRENKQNRGHFFQDRRDCQNKSGPLLPLQNRDSVVRVTVRPLLKGARREGRGGGVLQDVCPTCISNA